MWQSGICNALYPPGNGSACCHRAARAGRRLGDVLEAELLAAAMPKGRRVWGCPAHPGSAVGVRAGRVPAGHGGAAQPCWLWLSSLCFAAWHLLIKCKYAAGI